MKRKIHPHLKHFIHQMFINEIAPITGDIKKFSWKEELLKEIVARITNEVPEIKNQEELKIETQNQISQIKEEILEILRVTEKMISEMPIDTLNKFKS